MNRRLQHLAAAILIVVGLLLLPTLLSSRKDAAQAQGGGQGEIDALLRAYDAALRNELEHGTTQEIVDPSTGVTTVLVGESQSRMDRLWAETLAQINALQARPDSERASTVQMLREVSGAQPEYLSLARTPYDPSAELEEYAAGGYIYHVDIASGQIVMVWLENQRAYSVEDLYTEGQLAEMAQGHVARLAPGLTLDRLTLLVQNKEDEVFFFRWEDATRRVADGSHPFVQVAVSRAGDFLNFENTLPLASRDVSLVPTNSALASLLRIEPAFAVGANEVYANGGTRWGWERQDAPYSVRNNAGYCYTQGSWCTPKNFYYAPSPSGDDTYYGSLHRGKWTATSYMRYRNTRTSAYIPCTNATSQVFYRKWYNGGASWVENFVDQNIWCNTWVQMSTTLYDIQRVVLANTNELASTREIAWDEIWDYVP